MLKLGINEIKPKLFGVNHHQGYYENSPDDD